VIATSDPVTGIDIYIGQGGAPEGVLAAAALRCVGGQIQARLVFRNDEERSRATRLGISDFNRKYKLTDLAGGDVAFAATGVTDGSMLEGVHRHGQFVTTSSIPDAFRHPNRSLGQGAPHSRACALIPP